jgi:MarR family transcriptional regulator, negative regulator of the multidrug operon emrRAB
MHQDQDQITNMLGALALSLSDDMQAAARSRSGLGASACAVLVTLGPYPGSTIGAIARVLGLTHSVTVRLVEDLVERRLVKRESGKDRREVALRLTAKGASLRKRILAARSDALSSAMSALDADEKCRLGDALAAMLTRLTRSQQAADHICRLCDEEICTLDTCPVELEAVRLTQGSQQ